MMAEAGFNVVRLAEFAWSKMEPEEGRFDFAWLDRAIAILARPRHPGRPGHAHGLAAALADEQVSRICTACARTGSA